MLWHPFTTNYTHFLLDILSGYLYLKNNLAKDLCAKLTLPVHTDLPRWQSELLSHINLGCTRTNIDSLLPAPGYLQCICPSSVFIPIINHKGNAFTLLRQWIDSFRSLHTIDKCTNQVILSTRRDYRANRIKNLPEIEAYVQSINGSIIDPSRLNFADKISAFANASYVIGESAGALNGALFAKDECKIINLLDPRILSRRDFVNGGLIYHLGYAYKSTYIIGQDPTLLKGSPLASCVFPIELIQSSIA